MADEFSYPDHGGGLADAARREANIAAAIPLCDRCNGTGNELYSMYRACQKCGGSGADPYGVV